MKKITVIGSGIAGSLLCNQLVDQHEVTLLEKGLSVASVFRKCIFCRRNSLKCIPAAMVAGTTNLWLTV